MPLRLEVQTTRTGGDDQSPTSATDLIFTPTNLDPKSSPPVKNANTLCRAALTLWFGIVTIVISGMACLAAVFIKAYFLYAVKLRKSMTAYDADIQEEAVRGHVVDFAVWSVMYCCRKFNPVIIVGPLPSFTLQREAFSDLVAENARPSSIAKGVRVVTLPRGHNDNETFLVPPGCVVLSNHMSNIDGFSMKSALFPSASKAIIKAALTKVPIVGWLVSLSNEPLVHFTKSRGGWGTDKKEDLLARCSQVLERDYPLVVFPEGARRLFGRMAPFRHGMLKFAIEHQYPLLIAAIHGSERVWPVHAAMMNPGPIHIAFSDKLLLPSKNTDVVSLCNIIRDEMVTLLQGLPDYDAENERPIEDINEYKALEHAARKPGSSKRD